jgi:hypothetical protein
MYKKIEQICPYEISATATKRGAHFPTPYIKNEKICPVKMLFSIGPLQTHAHTKEYICRQQARTVCQQENLFFKKIQAGIFY